ncbi:MAG: hypothetical protein OEM21_10105, partial [Nitrosopumilus sp.]|nr:hypothetical protein [Nitrosopumilus sp.]
DKIHETSPSYFSLLLIKEVIDGPASPDDFYLTVNGNPVLSGHQNFYSAGTELTIDELQQPDYIFSSITGEGCPTQLNESFILTQNTVCTITNIHCLAPPFSFTIYKEVIGGPASPNDFALTVDESPRKSGQKSFHPANTMISIDETQQSNYIFSSITGLGCPTNLDEPFMLTKDTECTIINIFVPTASLTVIKNVVNNNNGTNVSGDFTMEITATDPSENNFAGSNAPGTTVTISPGSYSVDESGPGGYAATFSSECSGTAVAGESYVCTITNDDVGPASPITLTVIKNVVNNNNGTNVSGDFTMEITATDPSENNFAGSNAPGTTVTISPGSYSVDESGPGGYAATFSSECSGTAVAGESYVCTITNDDVGPASPITLTVIKRVLDGPKHPDDFALTVNDNPVLSNQTNIHSKDTELWLDEILIENYSFISITGDNCPTNLNESFILTQDTVCIITNSIEEPVFLKVIIDLDSVSEDIGLKVDGIPVLSGEEIFYKKNTILSIDQTKQTSFTLSITGNGDCPSNLDKPFTLTINSICLITLSPKSNPTGDNKWDTRPTFGVSHETRETQMVDWGFVFNGTAYKIIDNHHQPFEKLVIETNTEYTIKANVWAINKLKIQEFLFGIPQVGLGHLAEMRIEVWYDLDGKIDDVKIFQKTPVLDISRLSVNHEKIKCLDTDYEIKCDSTTIDTVFLEELKDYVMAIKATDFTRRDQTTYLNDGLEIFGKSFNPMKTMDIPSTVKGEGLITVTQTAKYSPYWVSEDGRVFEKNNFNSFKQLGINFERFKDTGTAYTRQHSEFDRVIIYEQKRALKLFNATEFISELPDSFSHDILITERITDEVKGKMFDQEQIAQELLEKNNVQARW